MIRNCRILRSVRIFCYFLNFYHRRMMVMKQNQKVFCVISHTHWDREWYSPLEIFRHRLVDLFDRLLIILEEHPEFVFHMDAQTVVLEDYLAVRPEKKELLKTMITNRRIMIGPWYLQNDFYLTSGEATVRNLIEGDKLCTEFGGRGEIGYAPDQFGNISQLPQILNNFGVDNFVFGRGFSDYVRNAEGGLNRKPSPTEFVWEGADGSKVLAIHMRHWYNNAQRFPANLDLSLRYLESIEQTFNNEFTLTPYLLLMNGVDHLEAQPDLLEVLDGLQERLPEGKAIMQYNFDDYIADVKEYIADNNVELYTHKGELRHGHDWELLKGTLSSRHYLKVANVEAQVMLENRLEPLYAMMERSGMKGVTSRDHFRYTWKNLLRNHPHDSICGCSRDEIHAHMANRYEEIMEFGNELMKRGMQQAADHMAMLQSGKAEEYLLTVANTLSVPVKGAVKVAMPFSVDDGFDNFMIEDANGNAVPFAVTNMTIEQFDVFSPINLPGTKEVKEYEAYIDVGEVAPYAFKTFIIRSVEGKIAFSTTKTDDIPTITNGILSLQADQNGRVTLVSGERKVENCIFLEDQADIGDSYVFINSTDTPILSDGTCTDVRVIEKNAYQQSLLLTYEISLPADYDFEQQCRSAQTAVTKVELTLTLKKDQPMVFVDYKVDNASKWHRLRVVVNTDVASDVSTADIPFDIVTHGEEMHYQDTYSKVLANTSFALLQQGEKGFAVLTKGAHEYQHLDGNRLAFTVVRATGGINRSSSRNWKTPGNQCLRTISGSMALLPYIGDVISADVANQALQFRAPLMTNVSCCDTHKFTGGRPCVQDTELNEIFYLPDAYPTASIPSNQSAISVAGEGLSVTAFKKSEYGEGEVVRFVNLSSKPTTATVTANGKIYRTTMAEKRKQFLAVDKVELTVAPKEIVTLMLVQQQG